MDGQGFHASRHYKLPRKNVLNAQSLLAEVTSEWFDVKEFDQLQINFDCTHGAGATTALTGYFETSSDKGTTAYRLQTSSISSGLETLQNHSFSKAFAATLQFAYALALPHYEWMRIVLDAQEAADIITADVILGRSG